VRLNSIALNLYMRFMEYPSCIEVSIGFTGVVGMLGGLIIAAGRKIIEGRQQPRSAAGTPKTI
jgi:hypothetical protein